MNFVNRPVVELDEIDHNILIDAINLFMAISTEAHDEGESFDDLTFEADSIVKNLTDFLELYVK